MLIAFAALPVKVLAAPTETVTTGRVKEPTPPIDCVFVVKEVAPTNTKEEAVTLFWVIPPLNSLGEVDVCDSTPVVIETVTAPTNVLEPKLSLSLNVPVIVLAPVTVKVDW